MQASLKMWMENDEISVIVFIQSKSTQIKIFGTVLATCVRSRTGENWLSY